jgi:hypothetical protein
MKRLVYVCLGLSVLLVPLAATDRPASDVDEIAAQPTGDAHNMRFVGYHDLQGRFALEARAKSDPENGNWLYIGHVPNTRDKAATMNPITGRKEWNGTSILEITDPANPRLVWHIPNEVNANSRSVSVVYQFGPEKRDYLARNSESEGVLKFQVFDITDRATDPSTIGLVSEIHGTPENSCGPGCGGRFVDSPMPREGARHPVPRAHKGWWSQSTGRYYVSSNEPGFNTTILLIWDLNDPRNPKFLGRAWLPGQKLGEEGFQSAYAHHPIVDEANNRMYAGFRDGSGQVGSWDISDPTNPTLVWSYDTSPPGRGPHTVSPIVYETVPNFDGASLPRTYALVTDEYGNECAPGQVKSKMYMFDITHETHPMPVSTWQVPVGDFCTRGGGFGPHQHAEHVNSELNRFEDRMAFVPYLNAGLRAVNIANPYRLEETGYYIPATNIPGSPPIQFTDVDIDHRGLLYVTERSASSCITPDGEPVAIPGGAPCRGTGLFVLEYTGPRAGK